MRETIIVDKKLKNYFDQTYGKQLADREMLEYKDRLIKFFSLLIEIDRRKNVTKTYEKPIK